MPEFTIKATLHQYMTYKVLAPTRDEAEWMLDDALCGSNDALEAIQSSVCEGQDHVIEEAE